MATSGAVNTNSYGTAYLRLEWTRTSYDSTTGVNYVHWVLKGVKSNSGYYNARNFKVTSYNFVTGNTTELYNSSSDIQLYNDTVIAEGDDYFTTNSDGTCRIQFNIEGAIYQYAVNCTGYAAWDVDTIPRKSSMTVSTGTIGGTNPTFTIDRKSNSFTHSIYYINPANSQEVLIVNKTSLTSYSSWEAPTSLYTSFPNAKSLTLTYKIYTYNGSTLVGSSTTIGKIQANENNCKPTATVTVTPTDYSSLTGDTDTIIKNASSVAVSVTAAGQNSGTIKKIATNNVVLSENTTTGSKSFDNVNTGTFTTVVTDSRGFTTTDIQTFTAVDYIPVTISADVYRANQTSSTIKAVVTGDYFDGNFGSQSNTLMLTWECKNSESGSYISGGTLIATKANGRYTTGEVTLTEPTGIDFDYLHNIYFKFKAVDLINTTGVTTTPTVKKGVPIYDYGVDSNGDNYLNVNGDIYSNNEKISKQEVTTGTEFATNEYIDGEQVFRKRIDCGTLPNATGKTVSSGLTPANVNIVKIQGAAKATTGTHIPLPFATVTLANCVAISLQYTGDIQIQTGIDRTAFTKSYVDLYYTKITT